MKIGVVKEGFAQSNAEAIVNQKVRAAIGHLEGLGAEIRESFVRNADRPERSAEVVWIKYSILQESRLWGRSFLRFGILLWSDS